MRAAVLTVLVWLWCAAPAPASDAGPAMPPPDRVRAAVAASLDPLARTVEAWPNKRTCTSCHHQSLPADTFTTALERGVPFDRTALADALRKGLWPLTDLDRAVQATRQIDPSGDWGTQLAAAASLGVPGNGATTALARLILERQRADGSWSTIDNRPPQSYDPIMATAYAVRSVDRYAAAGSLEWQPRAASSVARGREWLVHVPVHDATEATQRLEGLTWTGADADVIAAAAHDLRAMQRRDGGWSQLPRLGSDAFTTGRALAVLVRAGVASSDESIVRGARFLLDSQLPDGTWHVASRIGEQDLVSPPHFETGFPHGPDQIISAMATAVAATGLASLLPAAAPDPGRLVDPAAWRIPDEPAWVRVAQSGTVDDLRRALDGGLSPDAATPGGTSLLMIVAPDPARVQLLLDRGANPNRAAASGITPLMVAANHTGGTPAVRLLLDRGARVEPGEKAVNESTAVAFAIWSGDVETLDLLVARGGRVPDRVSIAGGLSYMSALDIALLQRDEPMMRALVRHGADPRAFDESGLGLIAQAVLLNDVRMVRIVLALGVEVDQVDQGGETALMHAAQIEYGETDVVKALLDAGASRTARNKDGKTALDLARGRDLAPVAAALEAPASAGAASAPGR